MSRILLIRHGQASFHAGDYDQLSERGHLQAAALGDWLLASGTRLDAIYTGEKRRQMETAQGVARQLRAADQSVPAAVMLPDLNEVRFEAVVRALVKDRHSQHAELQRLARDYLGEPDRDRKVAAFVRLARVVSQLWLLEQQPLPEGELWPDFRSRVGRALDRIRAESGRGQTIAVFTSAGPISAMLEIVLGCPSQQVLSMWWLLGNTSITELLFSERRITLRSFNSLPHLPNPADWTYL